MGTSWRSSALMAVVAGIGDGVLFLRFRVWYLGVRDRCTMSQAGRLRLTFYRIRASAIAACRISILSQCSVRELRNRRSGKGKNLISNFHRDFDLLDVEILERAF
jgi:hypothetical protein